VPEIEAVAAGKGVLRRGATGDGVKALQSALIALGTDVPGGADGAFGPGLEGAVKAFQAAHGLGADGVVGRGTLAALDAALGAASS
jgi:peptidoglycan hydrolase-like protein with peptidoglycan-binding domain